MLITILHFCLVAAALLLVAHIVKGFEVKDFGSALIVALVLGLANVLIRPILAFFSAPLNWVTFGLFTFVIDGALLKFVAEFIEGFKVRTWTAAIIGAVLLSIISGILHAVLLK